MRSIAPRENPFVPISPTWWGVLIGYVLVYRVFTPGIVEILYNGGESLVGLSLVMEIFQELLLFLPLFFYRPRRYGWLHPLLFPTFFSIGKSIVGTPAHLLKPLQVFIGPSEPTSVSPVLLQYGAEAIAWAGVEYQVYGCLALICYYAGFFFAERYTDFDFKPARLKWKRPRPRYVAATALVVVGLAFLAFMLFIQQRGGLSQYMLSYFGRGRIRAGGDVDGTVFFAVGAAATACMLWYALSDGATKNPLFWGAAMFAVPVEFFLTGSRAAVFTTAGLFLTIWMIRHQAVPRFKIVGLAVTALLLVGIMGEFRRSAYQGRMNWDLLAESSIESAVEATQEEVQDRRSVQGAVPMVAAVPDNAGFLYGKSYASAVFFFIPQFVWESKPHGVGRYNSKIILKRGKNSGGVPMGSVGEAYWNFSVPGVILIFFLFGIFHKGLARTLRRNAYAPVMWVVYVLAVLKLKPSSISFTAGARALLAATVIAALMGAITFRRNKG